MSQQESPQRDADLLLVKNLRVTYDDYIVAVDNVNLSLGSHPRVAIIGPNGAGKTSIVRGIVGFRGAESGEVTSGSVHFDGEDIAGWSPFKSARRGVVAVPERNKIFEHLTVQENLLVGAQGSREIGRAFEYFPALRERSKTTAGLLSGGERQMVAIGRAIVADPTLLIVDELSQGLAPIVVQDLMDRLNQWSDAPGRLLVLVEQNARLALDRADWGYVIENGNVVLSGSTADLQENSEVQEFYLGLRERGDARSLRDVKYYQRRRKWFA